MGSLELQKQTEFERLLSGQDFSGTNSDMYDLPQILEQKLADAISGEIDLALQKNPARTTRAILQNLCSKIPSTILTKYERAGKNYVRIEHNMGDSGNLFFSGIFEKSIQTEHVSDHHTIIQQNKICFVFRQ